MPDLLTAEEKEEALDAVDALFDELLNCLMPSRTLQNDFLKSPIIRESIDDSLLYRIREILDEEQVEPRYVEPRYRDFFQFVGGGD